MKTTLWILAATLCTSMTSFAQEAKTEVALTQVVTNDEGEKLLADGRGNTLYVFDLDQGKETSACNGTCAELWPPYLLTDAEAADLKAPLGFLVRANQKKQLTVDGRAVYAYALDRIRGDDQGDGVGGVWHSIEQQ